MAGRCVVQRERDLKEQRDAAAVNAATDSAKGARSAKSAAWLAVWIAVAALVLGAWPYIVKRPK